MGCGSSSLKGDFNSANDLAAPQPINKQISGTSSTNQAANQETFSNEIEQPTADASDPKQSKADKKKAAKRAQLLPPGPTTREELAEFYNPKKKGQANTPYDPSTGNPRALLLAGEGFGGC